MADYRILLDGMFAAAQTTSVPERLMRSFVAPPIPCNDGRATRAPLGLRLVEATLIREGYARDDVAIVPPEHLRRAVGPATRVVLVSSGDPLGLGMNDSTMSAIAGGEPYVHVWLRTMLRRLRAMRSAHPHLKVMVGGPGAWQLGRNDVECADLGIDVVFSGYAERDLAALVREVADGPAIKLAHTASRVDASDIPEILGPTSMGVVEISRGCGMGCRFCTLRAEPMVHLPVDKILHDVETNVRHGVTSVCLVSEDLLRYGGGNGKVRPEQLIELVEAVRAVPGLRLIQTDHVNVSSVLQFPQAELRRLHDGMTRGVRHEHLWVNIGVESASGELIAANGCAAKIRPFHISEWEEAGEEAVRRLIAAGFIPMVSLVFGLPGETQEHVRRTLGLVKRLAGERLMIFPLFYAPLEHGRKPFGLGNMTPLHWRLFRLCYRQNFRWLPRVYWDNQRGAGVPLGSRLLMQAVGRANALHWTFRFVCKSGKLFL